jgi:hypothetical protein
MNTLRNAASASLLILLAACQTTAVPGQAIEPHPCDDLAAMATRACGEEAGYSTAEECFAEAELIEPCLEEVAAVVDCYEANPETASCQEDRVIFDAPKECFPAIGAAEACWDAVERFDSRAHGGTLVPGPIRPF